MSCVSRPLCLLALVTPAQATFPAGNGKIALSLRGANGIYDIHTVNPDGSALTRLTSGTTSSFGPVWSADGKKIAFYGGPVGENDIYVMNANGSDQRRLDARTRRYAAQG